MAPRFILNLACNDYRNGLCQGHFESAHLGLPDGDDIEFEGPRVMMRESDIPSRRALLRIGRVSVFPTYSKEWYGNWCWNAYWISQEEARIVVNYLKKRGWGVTCAPTELFEVFEKPGEITPESWQKVLELEHI